MLFSNSKLIGFTAFVALALAISPATNAKSATIQDGIDLVEGWQPAQGETIHTITLVGDGRKYHIKAEKYAKNKLSNATCNATVVKGKKIAKTPCSTDVKEHDQIFTVSCTNDEKSNFARFIVNVSGEIEINTHGKIWAGFTSDAKDQKLRQSEQSMDALKASGNNVGVIINCVNDERSPSYEEQ